MARKVSVKSATEILRQDLLNYCKAQGISRSELARRMAQHGSNFHTISAFLRGGYDPAPAALSEIAVAFKILGGEVDHNAVLAAIVSATTPQTYLLEAILARPREEQDWIFGKLLARFAQLQLAESKSL